MAGKKTIAVVGATGAQGGGLVRAILADQGGPFAARHSPGRSIPTRRRRSRRPASSVTHLPVPRCESRLLSDWILWSSNNEQHYIKRCREGRRPPALQ
jgi:hypothetical protein